MSVSGTLTIEVSLDRYEIHLGSRYLKDALGKYGVLLIFPTEGPTNIETYTGKVASALLSKAHHEFIDAIGVSKFSFIQAQVENHTRMLESIGHENEADQDIKLSIQFFR